MLLAAAACGDRSIDLDLASPEGAESFVVIYEGERLDVEAHDRPAPILHRSGDIARVTVLHYREPLAAYGLPEGEVPAALEDECRRVPLPDPFLALAVDLEDGGALAPIDALPDAVASFRWKAACPCVDFTLLRSDVIPSRAISGAVAAGDDSVLVAVPWGLFVATATGVTPLGPFGPRIGSAHRTPDGTIWIGAEDGLYSGTLATGFTRTASSVLPIAIDGHDPGTPFELFTVHRGGEVRRLDDRGRLEHVYTGTTSPSDQIEDVAWIGPGRMAALLEDGVGPIHYDRSRTPAAEVEPWEPLNGPCAGVWWVEGLGLFLATRFFNLHRFESIGLWPQIDAGIPGRIGTVRVMEPRGPGFLFAGHNGRFGQYHRDIGFCFDTNFEGDVLFKGMVVLGDRVVLVGEQGDSSFVDWIELHAR